MQDRRSPVTWDQSLNTRQRGAGDKAEAVAPYQSRGFWSAKLKHLSPTLMKEHPKAKTGERERKKYHRYHRRSLVPRVTDWNYANSHRNDTVVPAFG